MAAFDFVRREGGVLGKPRATRPHHGVRLAEQTVDEFGVGVRIGHRAVLGASEETEQRAVVTCLDLGTRSRPPPQWITRRRFDFDHGGAAVGQQRAAVRSGDAGGQIDDGVAVERQQRGQSFILRFFLLSRNSGVNFASLSLTASASPASIASPSMKSPPSGRTEPPMDSNAADSRLRMYSPWHCLTTSKNTFC